MAIYNRRELKSLGFERVEDGGEVYYQYVIEPENYFSSDFLYSKIKGTGVYTVIRNSDGKDLTNTEVELIVNNNFED